MCLLSATVFLSSVVSMSWIPDPSTRQPLTWHIFTRECLPPLLLYYVTALLVITPRTFPIRLALLPMTLYATFRCATQVDLAKGYPAEDRLLYLNHGLLIAMTVLGARASIWTFQLEPYRRLKFSTANPFLDALDLSFNLRGIGWSWSSILKLPIESRNTTSTHAFLLSTLRSFLLSFLLLDFSRLAVQSFGFGPSSLFSPTGVSIFDPALAPAQRYLRSSAITLFTGLVMYHIVHTLYCLLTLVCVSFFQHDPTQWPPMLNAPWFSTSLNEFWACRWHQLFRHIFIAAGGIPSSYLFGKTGGILGAFLVSGVLHYLGLWGMGQGSDFVAVVGFFLMMGVGILAEHAYKAVVGRRVGGLGGWAWTMLWLLVWGNILADAWLVRGVAGSLFVPEEARPLLMLVRCVKRWLKLEIPMIP